MLTYTFENRGKKSYYQYLYEQMKEDILAGKLAAGTKLPSKRSFAKHLNLRDRKSTRLNSSHRL